MQVEIAKFRSHGGAGRLGRETYSFSKHIENYLDAIHLFITTYHLALRKKTTAG